MQAVIPRKIVESPSCAPLGTRQVEREFRRRVEQGLAIRPAGRARRRPLRLLSLGYSPKHKLELFDTTFYLTNSFQNYFLRFFVAYVVQEPGSAAHPRIFYKDASLLWRAASHMGGGRGDLWVGKGDVSVRYEDGDELINCEDLATWAGTIPYEILTNLNTRIPRLYL